MYTCTQIFLCTFLFRRHVCLSNFKHAPSRELTLTALKTVLTHSLLEILSKNAF